MKIYFPILFLVMAFFFLYIGSKVVLAKRPIFIPARYFFALIVIAFSPQFVSSGSMLSQSPSGAMGFLLWLNPVIFLCLIGFFWFQMKGYMVIGISDDTFRKALHSSLEKNELPFEEKLSVVQLTSLDVKLQIAIQSWVGAGQLKLGKSGDQSILPKIVSGMESFYETNDVKPNQVTSIFYIIMGVLMLACAVIFYLVFDKLSTALNSI